MVQGNNKTRKFGPTTIYAGTSARLFVDVAAFQKLIATKEAHEHINFGGLHEGLDRTRKYENMPPSILSLEGVMVDPIE